MNAPVPSKQALRNLVSLCAPSRSSTASTRAAATCSSRKLHTARHQPRTRDAPSQTYRSAHSSHAFSTHPSLQQDNPPTLPNITSHYTLFPSTLPAGPPPSGPFAIPIPALRKEFLSLQSSHHPDKYPTEPARSKALALSALINTSYRTLSDPLLRAQYLLHQNYSIDVNSEDNSAHPTDQNTLMEVMEAQERIEEATNGAEIEELLAENKGRIEKTTRKMAEAFERDDAEAAKNECVRLNYWRSLQEGLRDWEPGKEVRLIH